MFQDVLDRTHAQFAELLAPARKLNGLLLDNIEKLTQFQLEAVRAYSSLGFQQLRASCDISSAQGFQEYLSNQTKVAETLSKKLADDANTLTNLSKNFGEELQKFAQENVTVLHPVAQPTTKPASTKASRKSA
ncbi:phasin family protein [Alkalilimnicola ehrlichii]|uniref:phasin family protein n=1 Tax=Alkalilimnicola ehrlichii TaxID=351052 RepID=UPI0015F27F3A|nr:phasin family protein [Alkalilimnicola ehrlichii]